MPSVALVDWKAERAARLDNLLAAHRATTGGTRGRKYHIEEINHALIVRLASEFQGYCRDLHDESLEATLSSANLASKLDDVFRVFMSRSRKLDSGNANWANICLDFGPFGVSLATEMKSKFPVRYDLYVEVMKRLNSARNALAHQNQKQLIECQKVERLTLATFQRWRSALNQVATGLDAVMSAYLKDLTGQGPW